MGMTSAQLGVEKRPGYMYWPMPSSVLAGIAVGREAAELALTRVARADLDLAVAHARVEAVERAHRRAAGDLALEVVDAAVARADEALGGLDVAHRAAEVHAARGDRDELRVVARSGSAAGRSSGCAAHVDRGLADLADALGSVITRGM